MAPRSAALAVVLALVSLACASCSSCSACSKSSGRASPTANDAAPENTAQEATAAPSISTAAPSASAPVEEKVTVEDVVVGKGREAKLGDKLTIHYVLRLADTEKEVDSSRARGAPYAVDGVGQGKVLRGWDQGMLGMRVGGTRKITVPPSFGYGEAGAPPLIPPKATLVFEVELLAIK
jgi:FKBP-type peptidyl-prolyl cis-trans isomerase